jgi:hypothetical protein
MDDGILSIRHTDVWKAVEQIVERLGRQYQIHVGQRVAQLI